MGEVLLKASAYVFVIALGYGLKKAGFFKPDDYKLIMKIALNITMRRRSSPTLPRSHSTTACCMCRCCSWA